ncbi:hypothetical protein GCM10010910_27660 [Microbacterium nanhaiense]|uniref:Uncharacterized protein n=1 Tax=Microbacterium nanhaiense TaxID=1301026 RepID=A0ABQ2N5G5_9MICO|nr:hypothetical protein [Microbacterium nanhaiense]GGO66968.1 hypothetical protein GCM10010910_27660 [Microbacterium nanhaiense]
MPYIVMLRPTATIEFEVPERDGLDYFNEDAARLLPEGHELIDIDRKRGVAIARSTETKAVTVDRIEDAFTCAPEGWQALSVRPA